MQDPSTTYSQINPQFPEHQRLNCPRCDSTNTKFCYYNNYNLSQPRHFCKHCKRYWTKGGILRNIPVGGASRKITKRPKKSPTSPAPATSTSPTTAQSQSKLPVSFDHDGGGGRFRSRLPADGSGLEFTENPISDGSGMIEKTSPNEFRSTTNSNNSVSCLGVQNGDGLGYGGWPGLSIFMPGSDFQ